MALTLPFGCTSHGEQQVVTDKDSTEVPTMVTQDVSMYISDSGVIKYHALAPTWIRYSEDPQNEYQYFPDGITLHQLDTAQQIIGTIVADTAYNYERKQLWHLIMHVDISTVQQETFRTNDLYWDMREHKVYSDSFIHIERPDGILEGYGFTANDDFTKYTIRQSSGIFPVKDDQPKAE